MIAHMAEPGRLGQIGNRWGLRTALVFLLSLLLAACAGGPQRPQPGVTKAPAPVAKAAPQQGLPEDVDRHRVALLVPMTGPNAGVGQSIANAAVLALADTKDRSLRVTTYDTGPSAAAAAARALAEGNQLILGPLLGEDVKAVASVAVGHVPVVAFSNDTTVAGDGVWLLGFQPAQAIERVVKFARSKGMTRFAGLVPQGAYGRTASATLIRVAEASGGSVVAMQNYDRSPGAITAAVTTIAKQKFDAVLIADSGRVAVIAVPLLRKKGAPSAQILGTELWNAEPGLAQVPSMQGAWFASVGDQMFGQLTTRYRARYAKTPYRLASLGYDAVLLAVRIARDWKAGEPFPVDRLDDEGGFAGVDGAFRFSKAHLAERALAVHQVDPNGWTVVSAPPSGF